MKIEMTSKIIDITPAIRERIESRFEKLERLQVPLITPHVIISKERLMYIVEATAGIPNGKLFAQAEHEDLYAAITDLGQKLERQLNRHIEKPLARRAAVVGKDVPEVDEADAKSRLSHQLHKKAGHPAFLHLVPVPLASSQPAQARIHSARQIIQQRQHEQGILVSWLGSQLALPAFPPKRREIVIHRGIQRRCPVDQRRGSQRQPEPHIGHATPLLQTLVERTGV